MRALLLVLLLLAPAAVAYHSLSTGRCDNAGPPSLGTIEIGAGSPESTFYVDDRNYLFGDGLWIYKESNGVWNPAWSGHENLQRGGEAFTNPYVPDELGWDYGDVCTDPDPAGPDMLVF